MKITYCLLFPLILLPLIANTQVTTGSLMGRVTNTKGEDLAGATIAVLHSATQTRYVTETRPTGLYNIDNLSAGGPYLVEVSLLNHASMHLKDLYISLSGSTIQDFVLKEKENELAQVTVRALTRINRPGILSGNRSVLSQDLLEKLPVPGQQLSDYLRAVPHTGLRNGEEGAVSFGGQNNRYNSFYVDGAIQNDVFGLSASGTNGGQAGISPISLESIEQIQVVLSPFDVSLGNFTGAGIQAVTKSGSNQNKGSVYQSYAGAIRPDHLIEAVPVTEGNNYQSRRTGLQLQGAFKPNRLFYFFNAELERNVYPKRFPVEQYTGTTRDPGLLNILSRTLTDTYHYDPGSLWYQQDIINADRLAIRIDWNAGSRSKFTFSYRYALGDRTYTNQNDNKHLHFSNDGYHLDSRTQTFTAEWKTAGGHNGANSLLLTHTKVTDNREPNGSPFPSVRINDGDGVIQFGTDNSSGINYLSQRNLTLFDKYSFWAGKHLFHLGTDWEFNHVHNAFIQNSFGHYSFSSLGNFLTQAHPSGYQLGMPLLDSMVTDQTKSAAKFSKLKASFYLGDQYRPSARLSLEFGIRIDYHRLLQTPAENPFVNDSLLPVLARYYDIRQTRSGIAPRISPSVSPRIGFLYAIPMKGIIIQGGMGLFAGRIPLVWPGGSYQHNGLMTSGYLATPAVLQQIRFRPDPYHQWGLTETGSEPSKITIDLMSPTLALPKRFSGTLSIEKKWIQGWTAGLSIGYGKTVAELQYTNINLLPPVNRVSGPDNRWVYSSDNNARIPLRADGYNPFDYVILVGNRQGNKGYTHSFSAVISRKPVLGWEIYSHYSWGKSIGSQDGRSSINSSQWRFVESVNGRNELELSESDYSPGHRVFVLLSKDLKGRSGKNAFHISFSYTGSSGTLFSYVYGGGSLTRDDGLYGAYDLVYIPDAVSLESMIFLPFLESGKTYSPEEQKTAFGRYIEQTPYLQKRRGQYAERNGSRTPFSHRADLGLKKTIPVSLGNHRYYIESSLDIYNVLNLINSNWGRVYEVPYDAYPLLSFAGYAGNGGYIPQYYFDPKNLTQTPWEIAGSNYPLYSSFWVLRLGMRIRF